jgi:hypothetical protein
MVCEGTSRKHRIPAIYESVQEDAQAHAKRSRLDDNRQSSFLLQKHNP